MVRTLEDSITKTSSLYAWGSNNFSELGLGDKITETCQDYHLDKEMAFLKKPMLQASFGNMVHRISCGGSTTLVHCIDPDTK
jgi:alpha-tubulin suppressor-like RCC1 family protein